MTRVPYATRESMDAAGQAVWDEIETSRGGVARNYAAILNNPQAAGAMAGLGGYARYETPLPPRIKALAVLTAAREACGHYVWTVNQAAAREAGTIRRDRRSHPRVPRSGRLRCRRRGGGAVCPGVVAPASHFRRHIRGHEGPGRQRGRRGCAGGQRLLPHAGPLPAGPRCGPARRDGDCSHLLNLLRLLRTLNCLPRLSHCPVSGPRNFRDSWGEVGCATRPAAQRP